MQPSDEVLRLWQSQSATLQPFPAEEIRRRFDEMEKKRRRALYDSIAAYALIALVMTGLAVVSPNGLMTAGALLSMAGFAIILAQVFRHRRMPRASAEPESSATAYRLELERRLRLVREARWVRVASLTPGPLLFMMGMARAYPNAAPIVYVQIATFAFAVAAIVPLNRRKAAGLQREIDEVLQLEQ